jgi:hypothetical protein
MRQFMESDEQDRLKSICEGIRRGLPRVVMEPLPSQIEELLRMLERQEQSSQASKSIAPAMR